MLISFENQTSRYKVIALVLNSATVRRRVFSSSFFKVLKINWKNAVPFPLPVCSGFIPKPKSKHPSGYAWKRYPTGTCAANSLQ